MESSRLLNFPALVTGGNLPFVPLQEWEMLMIIITPRQSSGHLGPQNGRTSSTKNVLSRHCATSLKV
ncbi:hypothetical protein, partial [Escherichia coli]|uniref:hypothetical protein n=1 Tax=Escherichia coli TaxID=562 RepID=UPI00197ACAFA